MAIGTPLALGYADNTATAATCVLTTTGASSAGDSIIVVLFNGSSTPVFSSLTDSAGNTYTTDFTQSGAAAGTGALTILSCHNATVLGVGGTMTATWTATATQNRGIFAFAVSGLTGPKDKAVGQAVANNINWNSTSSGTLAQADELAVGAVYSSSGSTSTVGGGFTELRDGQTVDLNHFVVQYLITSATTAVTSSGTTGSVASDWSAALVTYPAAGSTARSGSYSTAVIPGVVISTAKGAAGNTASNAAPADTVSGAKGGRVAVTATSRRAVVYVTARGGVASLITTTANVGVATGRKGAFGLVTTTTNGTAAYTGTRAQAASGLIFTTGRTAATAAGRKGALTAVTRSTPATATTTGTKGAVALITTAGRPAALIVSGRSGYGAITATTIGRGAATGRKGAQRVTVATATGTTTVAIRKGALRALSGSSRPFATFTTHADVGLIYPLPVGASSGRVTRGAAGSRGRGAAGAVTEPHDRKGKVLR